MSSKKHVAGHSNFWQQPLDSLSSREWELLCDGCGRCCLKKLQVPLFEEGDNRAADSVSNSDRSADIQGVAAHQNSNKEEVFYTRVICRYYRQNDSADAIDASSREANKAADSSLATGCGCYDQRSSLVPDCLVVKEHAIEKIQWMPSTCAYRLRFEGKPLYDWHPLIAGDRKAMLAADIAVEGKVISEEYVHEDGLEEHIIRWVEPANPIS